MPARFTVDDVISTTFLTLGRNFLAFVAMDVLVYLPMLVYTYVIGSRDHVTTHQLEVYNAIGFLGRWVINTLLVAMVTCRVVDPRFGLVACVQHGVRRFLPALGVSLLVDLLWAGGTLLLVVPGMMLVSILWVALPASVIEKPGIRGALDRSRTLTLGRRWHVFGVLVVLTLFWVVPWCVVLGIFEPSPSAHAGAYVWSLLSLKMAISLIDAVAVAVAYTLLRGTKEGSNMNELGTVFE